MTSKFEKFRQEIIQARQNEHYFDNDLLQEISINPNYIMIYNMVKDELNEWLINERNIIIPNIESKLQLIIKNNILANQVLKFHTFALEISGKKVNYSYNLHTF